MPVPPPYLALLALLMPQHSSPSLEPAQSLQQQGLYFQARVQLERLLETPDLDADTAAQARALLAQVLTAQGLSEQAQQVLQPPEERKHQRGGLFGLFRGEEARLAPGEEFTGALSFDGETSPSQSFELEVPPGTARLRVDLSCHQTDLDLYVARWSKELDRFEDIGSSTLEGGMETVMLDPWAYPTFTPGRYQVEVRSPYPDVPVWNGQVLDAVDYSLSTRLEPAHVDALLRPGTPLHGALDRDVGDALCFRVTVPEKTAALRLDVLETDQNLDLYARHGSVPANPEQARYSAEDFLGRESLLIQPENGPYVAAGDWYVLLVGYDDPLGRESPFTLLASLSADPPPATLALPELPAVPADATALERAAACVVEIYTASGTGSGTLLDARGLILTNAHVVADYADAPVDEIVVGMPLRRGQPPVELFRARVRHFDAGLDLAVLEIAETLLHAPLPADFRFPTVPLADSAALRLGAPLWVLGYPVTGGAGSRNSITVTRGIVCGFEESAVPPLLKTDAPVTSGNSGGACLDESGGLVGVPSQIIETGGTSLGFVIPIRALPEAWRAELRARQ